jgi:hypothetical protein
LRHELSDLAKQIRTAMSLGQDTEMTAAIPDASSHAELVTTPESSAVPNSATAMEYRKAIATTMRSSIPRLYPEISEALGLDRELEGRVFDLLAEHEAKYALLNAGACMSGSSDLVTDCGTAQQQQREAERVFAESMRRTLGDTRYSDWVAYAPTRGSRLASNVMASYLDQADLTLTRSQRAALAEAIIADQRSRPQGDNLVTTGLDPWEALARRQEDSNRRLLNAAIPVLSASHIEILRKEFDRQAAVIDAANKKRRQ